MWDFLKVYGAIIVLVAAGFVVAYQFVDPAPPGTLVMATGDPEGAYHAFGRRYQEILARDGIEVRLVTTAGSGENLQHLVEFAEAARDQDAVDIAFVQSGVGSAEATPALRALASLYFEPLWIFIREEAAIRLGDLAGKRLAVGAVGSGTRKVALELLAANAIRVDDGHGTQLLALGAGDAAAALLKGEIDAAFIVSARRNSALDLLLSSPEIELLHLDRAEAYARRFRYLTRLELPEGVLDFAENKPWRDIALLSPAATLVAREDLHPALIDLVMRAAGEIHGSAGLFEEPGQFPSPRLVDFPLSPDAERYFKSGLGFLDRYLPYWAATLVGRTWVLILPVLTLLIPLMRIAPPTYRWQVRRRIIRWYRELRRLEAALREAAQAGDTPARQRHLVQLEGIQDEVGQLSVPLGYADDLYRLRMHIEFVRARFAGGDVTSSRMSA